MELVTHFCLHICRVQRMPMACLICSHMECRGAPQSFFACMWSAGWAMLCLKCIHVEWRWPCHFLYLSTCVYIHWEWMWLSPECNPKINWIATITYEALHTAPLGPPGWSFPRGRSRLCGRSRSDVQDFRLFTCSLFVLLLGTGR